MCPGASNMGKPDKPSVYKHIIGNKKKPFLGANIKKGAKKQPQKNPKKQETKRKGD
jgi:hypothetical protein